MMCSSIHILHKTVRKYWILQMTLKIDLLNVVWVLWLFKCTEEMVQLHTWSYISYINEQWTELCDCSQLRMEITQWDCESVVNNEQNPREDTWCMVSVRQTLCWFGLPRFWITTENLSIHIKFVSRVTPVNRGSWLWLAGMQHINTVSDSCSVICVSLLHHKSDFRSPSCREEDLFLLPEWLTWFLGSSVPVIHYHT